MNHIFSENFEKFKQLCLKTAQAGNYTLTIERPILIFGTGKYGRDLCAALLQEGFDVQGFVETKPRNAQVLDLPVMAWNDLSLNWRVYQLALGIFNREAPLDILEQFARTAGVIDIAMPWDLHAQFGHKLGWRYWLSAQQEILSSLPAIERTYNRLSDEKSRECLLELCAFRLGRNNKFASMRHEERQYFNELTLGAVGERSIRYIDGGAYDGDTFLELLSYVRIAAAFLFEPDHANYVALSERVKKCSANAMCFPLALSDQYRILTFNSGSGEGSSIVHGGTSHIASVALDVMMPIQHVDFIKLDIEGEELPALTGAAGLIKRCRPILAISLYHRPHDIWEIPEMISSLCDDYLFFIRQHHFNSFDSVFYAVPNGGTTNMRSLG
jgi:FkbM family methyltransferase